MVYYVQKVVENANDVNNELVSITNEKALIKKALGYEYAEMYFKGSIVETTLTKDTPKKVTATYLSGLLTSNFSIVDGAIYYTGVEPIVVMNVGSCAIKNVDGGTPDYVLYFAKNGLLSGKSATENDTGSPEASVSFQCNLPIVQGDYIEVYVENVTNNDDLIVQDLNVIIKEM